MTKHDWTKLTNGWVRLDLYCSIMAPCKNFRSHDDGDFFCFDKQGAEESLRLATEAVEQRKQCEVREPRFAFGDWVNGAVGKGARVVKVEFDEVNQDHRYALLTPEDGLRWLYEGHLEPCDPPGDGGWE